MAAPPGGRIGRYDNPYRVATWHREPPASTGCDPLLLDTQDGALAHGWLYSQGGEDTVVVFAHPRADFSHHYAVPGLVERGLAVCGVNTRWLNNDATLIHEQVVLDVAAAVDELRAHYDRVVLCGNSGGGSLFTFYLAQAAAPDGGRLTDTAAGDPFDLNRFELPHADAMVYLAAHPGEGHFLMTAIDASVTNDTDPLSCDPDLDPFSSSNGFVEPPGETHYESEFIARYRAAQHARVERLDATARTRVTRRHEARRRWKDARHTDDRRTAIATDFMTVYRTDADLRTVDLSLDPSARSYGSIWGVRPDWINYGAVGFGRVISPEAWLSTWSGLSSRAGIEHTGGAMTLPSFMASYSGDHCIFPSDDELIANSLANPPERAVFDADHYGHPFDRGREPAVAAIADWIKRTG